MNVRKEEQPADPAYPDAKDFLKNRVAIGAAILGAGMALGGCVDQQPLGGVVAPVRTGGVPASPDQSRMNNPDTWPGGRNHPDNDPVPLPGKQRVVPKQDHPPLPGTPPVPRPEY